MGQQRNRRRPRRISEPDRLAGHLGRGWTYAFFTHAVVLAPFVITAVILGRREAEQHASEVQMTVDEVKKEDLPSNLPPIDDVSEPAAKKKPADAPAKVAQDKPPDEPPPPKPVVQPPAPPEEKKPVAPVPPPPPKSHEKMVDLDQDKESEVPKDAKYLAQKNHRVEKETRATDTNLERQQKGDTGSSPSDRTDDKPGDKIDKVAELEDQKSKLGRQAPVVTPHVPRDEQHDLQRNEAKPSPQSLLSLRNAPKRQHEITPETADALLPRDPDGLQAAPEEGLASVKDLRGVPGNAARPRLQISGKSLDCLFGADADAARRLAQKERSQHGGKFTRRLGQIQSALENFIPEVQPGNQTELNTRAAPFAVYIARMHRSIHKLWGFGFLEDLNSKPSTSAFNNPALVTQLELVLNGDGTVDKVGVIRSSGYTPYDAAAVDVAYTAGPYPDPPQEIRSTNGKIYVHWSFHRDERQCATSGADYFILNNGPPTESSAVTESAGIPGTASRPRGGRRTSRDFNDSAHQAKMRELDQAAGGAEASSAHEAKPSGGSAPVDEPGARMAADSWFGSLAKGDIKAMVRLAAFPFVSSGGVAAQDAAQLTRMLQGLLEETGTSHAVRALQVYSAAGARDALGSAVDGGKEGGDYLYGIGHMGDATLVAILAPRRGNWKVVGLVRR